MQSYNIILFLLKIGSFLCLVDDATMSNVEFSFCSLIPVVGDESSSSSVVFSTDGKWKASSFYLDSSGRSSISLPLQLKFRSRKELVKFISCNCFSPSPSNFTVDKNMNDISSNENASLCHPDDSTITRSIGIEAKVTLTFGTGSARVATVEGVTILSTRVGDVSKTDEDSIYLNTEIVIRVSRGHENEKNDADENSKVKTNLEVTAVLIRRSKSLEPTVTAFDALQSFSMHGSLDHSINRNLILTETRLNPPIVLHVELTHALSISVKSVDGPRMGHTFLSLTMTHSNTHHQPVIITSIALHPGHARYKLLVDPVDEKNDTLVDTTNNLSSSGSFMADMSRSVKWGYATGSDPHLPFKLERNEAYSTILTVDASDDVLCRSCSCPLSITATIGSKDHDRRHYVVVAVEANWSTSRAALEPTDSFRVELSVDTEHPIVVSTPLTVFVDVYNLCSETRQLMLFVDNPSPQRHIATTPNSTVNASKSVVLSEKGGYKFGVWGLSSPIQSAGSTFNRDTPEEQQHDYLAIDVALLLGEVKGQTSTKAKLRIIPLREGTLRIPNFKLVDNRSGKQYYCIHRFHVVVAPATS